MKKYWKITNKASKTAEILIYEQIGESFFTEGLGAKQFIEDLRALGDIENIDIRINSPGGSVFEGLAIYNTLKTHKAKKTVYIDGVSASIASAIAMAGDKVIMPENALMMIHDPHALAMGDAETLRKMADTLDKTAESLVSIYKDKCGKTENEIREKMKAETWFSAQEAIKFGICDESTEAMKMAAHFDYSKFFNTPKVLLNHAAVKAGAMQDAGDGNLHKDDGNRQASANKTVAGIEVIIDKEAVMNKCPHCDTELAAGVTCKCQSISANARKERDTEINEILAIASKHNAINLAQKHISEGKSKAEFVEAVLISNFNAKPIENLNPMIGMSNKEKKNYSLLNAIRGMWLMREVGKPFDGLEKEASDVVAKIVGRKPNGFFIPEDIFNPRAVMQTGDGTKGGFTVGTDVLGGEMIELLRNKTLIAKLGARQLSGLVGNVAIPRVTGGAIAYWLPETGEVTASEQAFGQLGLTPHRLVGDTAFTKELLMQSSIPVEAFIRDDLMRVLAIALDLAAINGSGSNGQPTGILNVTGIGGVTFGAAATWAKIVDFETQVADANADFGALAYITTPSVRGKWKTVTKIASSQYSDFLWGKGDGEFGEVNGYKAAATKQIPSNKVLYGNLADLILASWAGLDVVVDPYSLKKSGQIEITITQWADVAVRHAGSFCASSDSGAQ